jgi:hypothetical protein
LICIKLEARLSRAMAACVECLAASGKAGLGMRGKDLP